MSVMRRPWRRCSACRGVCHWHDEAWVCDGCGSEWYPEHGKRYAAPGDCRGPLAGNYWGAQSLGAAEMAVPSNRA